MLLNDREMIGYAGTLLQERVNGVFEELHSIAADYMEEIGVAESDLDDQIRNDIVFGLLAKLIKRQTDGDWPFEADFDSQIDAILTVEEKEIS
jgi:hypothetical protein